MEIDPFVLTFAVALAGYVMVLFVIFKVADLSDYKNLKEEKRKFYRALKMGLTTGTIETMTDVDNIYKGIKRESLEGSSYQKSLNIWLREFNLDLVSKDNILLEDKEIEFKLDDNLTVKKYKNLIDGFIKELDEKEPFAELEDAERNLLNDITLMTCRDGKNEKLIRPKLMELADIVNSKDKELKSQKTINKIAITLAIVGIFLTVLFGILSVR